MKKCNACGKEVSGTHYCQVARRIIEEDNTDFIISVAIGALTGSALLGGLIGGSLLGGLLGDSLDGDIFDD